MAKNGYKWRESFRAPGRVEATQAAKELDRIRTKNGTLTPDAVVEESRPVKAPLHRAFEWDDQKAATQFRRHQATTLIRALVVIETNETPEHRKFVLVDDTEGKQVYEDATIVVNDEGLFVDCLRRLESAVASARKSVSELEELARNRTGDAERTSRLALAAKALEAASKAVAGLH